MPRMPNRTPEPEQEIQWKRCRGSVRRPPCRRSSWADCIGADSSCSGNSPAVRSRSAARNPAARSCLSARSPVVRSCSAAGCSAARIPPVRRAAGNKVSGTVSARSSARCQWADRCRRTGSVPAGEPHRRTAWNRGSCHRSRQQRPVFPVSVRQCFPRNLRCCPVYRNLPEHLPYPVQRNPVRPAQAALRRKAVPRSWDSIGCPPARSRRRFHKST